MWSPAPPRPGWARPAAAALRTPGGEEGAAAGDKSGPVPAEVPAAGRRLRRAGWVHGAGTEVRPRSGPRRRPTKAGRALRLTLPGPGRPGSCRSPVGGGCPSLGTCSRLPGRTSDGLVKSGSTATDACFVIGRGKAIKILAWSVQK